MVKRLAIGEASVNEIAEPFLTQMSLPAVTKHLKVLEKAHLITKSRNAQWRPCKINGEPLKVVDDWVNQYRQYWEESFDRLEAYLKTVTTNPDKKSQKSKLGKGIRNEQKGQRPGQQKSRFKKNKAK
ncbi:MAG: metalloregulator ArsR/SmtB family transcription factor [Proteobacteria bacterium]|nr:metalloregulator ArsR/SmtB family transcription factor [Pseudomonadota bacterium]